MGKSVDLFDEKTYASALDNIPNKLHQDAQIFGKPQVIVNPQKIINGEYINQGLRQFNASELIELAESNHTKKFQTAGTNSPIMKKIYDKLDKDKFDTEYGRA